MKTTSVIALLILCINAKAQQLPAPCLISSGWQLQDAAKISQSGAEVAKHDFKTTSWYAATVPGTVLTTLVNNNVYPEPLYGENNRPDKISDSLCRTNWWYRTTVTVPRSYAGRKIWLNFDGINYAAEVWVNGKKAGNIKGAFIRGIFDITTIVTPGKSAVLAVLVAPQPNPGIPHEHTIADGMGKNGGITAMDGPTFLCSMGWDWMPAIRDRNTGIWQKVFLSATGGVLIKDPLVTTRLPLPDTTAAKVTIQTTLQNITGGVQQGILKGKLGDITFQLPVTLPANSVRDIVLDAAAFPQLQLKHPKLWWPNGYGEPNLYELQLSFEAGGKITDSRQLNIGIREISYSVPGTDDLTISVNGVKVFIKGGNWGMDEAMKRIPRHRLEAQVKMHRLVNYNMIRNWVGQSTSEDLYDLCDKYGILLWDEFFQPNPSDGPNPVDLPLYLSNVRDKILRFRNHPCIALWCARNEGHPPKEIDSAIRTMMDELEPLRLYQPSSTDGRGVRSGGPYYWRKPAEYYVFSESFKTEIGSFSAPTLESVQGMMPQKDWEVVNDDWAEHDLATKYYRNIMGIRYGTVLNLADYIRKAQLSNYEAFRAMYEGRNAKLFNPTTGVITWMSNPAQPSFVWQLYHHDLEPNASFFAVKKACEPIHIQLNEKEGNIQVINNLPVPLTGAKARLALYNLDGSIALKQEYAVTAAPSRATDLGMVNFSVLRAATHFVKLTLEDASGRLLSDNFYWNALPLGADKLLALDSMPVATIKATAKRRTHSEKCILEITISNPGSTIALMTHLQLRGQRSQKRVLPVYYTDNYISLLPGESKTVTIEAALADLKGEAPLVLIDGWNITIENFNAGGVAVALNQHAQVSHWPVTYLPRPEPEKVKTNP